MNSNKSPDYHFKECTFVSKDKKAGVTRWLLLYLVLALKVEHSVNH